MLFGDSKDEVEEKKKIKLLNNSYSDHRSILPQGNTDTNTNTCYNFKYQIQS